MSFPYSEFCIVPQAERYAKVIPYLLKRICNAHLIRGIFLSVQSQVDRMLLRGKTPPTALASISSLHKLSRC
ncbi:hypothetical protein CNECB9_4370005 [Cupriavidus necator]|uniref:Uncharacterized protein n=1 Tax=Cupriavidus necator TaxID=106590 RepID=A0A1K0JJK4_CUPNE|nr:hypothetical protein CNECB9_4370005 [Cupriavidus necator]